jgi:phenylalanyl-tRNA synthetase beta chain
MRVPLSWLDDHVDIHGVPVAALADKLTFAGLEIESVTEVGADLAGVTTARVLQVRPHPEADRLHLIDIDAGGDTRQVVAGASNMHPGDVVAWAAPGAKLPGGLEIGRRKLRGTWSDGMLTSARELGVGEDHSGILVLPPDTPVGADAVEAVGLHDTILQIKTFPNRGDTMSIRGIARETAIVLGRDLKPLQELDDPPVETGPDAATLASVAVEDTDGCRRYSARVLQGADAARPSPLRIARRLYLYGQRPLSAVVDVTNYLMLDVGQPLHAFDLDRIPGHRILVRRARPGEVLRTLDGRDRTLTPEDTVISAGEPALALAGIMGGEDTEVTAATRRVLIEAAHFPPHRVRATMRRLGMQPESAQRWARGVDPELAEATCDRAAALMQALAGGQLARGRLAAGPGSPQRPVVELDWTRSARRLAAPPDPAAATEQLARVGCQVTVSGTRILARPPSWRFDLEGWADLEEEIARHRGYHLLPATLPKATGGGLTTAQRNRRRVRQLLADAGLVEVAPDPFLSPAALDALGLPAGDPRRAAVRIANPLSDTEPLLRTTLLPGLAEVARANLARGAGTGAGVAVFEVGQTAQVAAPPADPDRDVPDQPRMLAVLLAGTRPPARFDEPAAAYDYADLKGLLDALVTDLAVPGVTVAAAEVAPYHPGRCAAVHLDGQLLGHIGQLHPRVTSALGLPAAAYAAELHLDPLLAAVPTMRPAPPSSPFPELDFDIAFLVPPGVPAQELEASLRDAGGALLTGLELFDAYQGDPLPPGHRNLAYHVTLRAPDRTLSDTDAQQTRERMQAAARRHGAQLRAT